MRLILSLVYMIYVQFQEFWFNVRENHILCKVTNSLPWDHRVHDEYCQKQIESILEANGMERLEIHGDAN